MRTWKLVHFQCLSPCRRHHFRILIPGVEILDSGSPRCHECNSYPLVKKVYSNGEEAAMKFSRFFRLLRNQNHQQTEAS